jgi:hypothetical protein
LNNGGECFQSSFMLFFQHLCLALRVLAPIYNFSAKVGSFSAENAKIVSKIKKIIFHIFFKKWWCVFLKQFHVVLSTFLLCVGVTRRVIAPIYNISLKIGPFSAENAKIVSKIKKIIFHIFFKKW